MIQVFQEIFGNYIVAGVLVIFGLCWFVWKIATMFQSMNDKIKEINNLPCSNHDARIKSHTDQLNETQATLGEIKGQLDLLVKLSTISRTKPLRIATEEYSEKESPRKLNKNGETLFNDISGEAFLMDNQKLLFSEIDKLAPKTALDVENFALAVLRANLTEDIFIPLKMWVYNEPSRQITKRDGALSSTEVSMDDVLFVLSIPLRDKYLKEHPNIIQ